MRPLPVTRPGCPYAIVFVFRHRHRQWCDRPRSGPRSAGVQPCATTTDGQRLAHDFLGPTTDWANAVADSGRRRSLSKAWRADAARAAGMMNEVLPQIDRIADLLDEDSVTYVHVVPAHRVD